MLKEGVEWIVNLRFEDIPERVVKKAKLQILSVLASAFAGNESNVPLFLKDIPGKGGDSTVLTVPPARYEIIPAIFTNTMLSMAHDYDDYTFLAHTGHSAVLVSLALSEAYGFSGKDFLKGVVIANELEGRIGASVVLGPLNGQMVAHIHSAGASAIYSTMIHKDYEAVYKSVLLSLSIPPRTLLPSFMWGDTKFLTASIPSVNGLLCGMIAPSTDVSETVLYGEDGFFNKFSFLPLYSMFTGWGKVWTTNAISYKIYPGCAYIDSAVDCMTRIMEKFKKEKGRPLQPSDVKEIEVEVTLLSWVMEKHSNKYRGDEISPVNLNFSIALSLALMVVKGEISVKVLKKEVLRQCKEEILNLANRIKIKHNSQMTLNMIEKMLTAVNFLSLPEIKLRNLIRPSLNLRREHGRLLSLQDMVKLIPHLFKLRPFIKNRRISDLSQTCLDDFPTPFSARVILKTSDRTYEEFQEHPLGSAGRPFEETESLVKEKFMKEAGRIGMERAERIMKKILSVETLHNVKMLFE